MTPIWKKISKKGISLLLALSLFVGAAGTVSANAAIDGRAEASAAEEVVTDPAETALDEVKQPAAGEAEAEPEAGPEPPTAEDAESEPPAEEETLVPETETTQEDATELAAAGDAGRAGAIRLPSDWEEKMKEYFPDENLRRMVKEKFESGEAYRGGKSTEDVLGYSRSFTLEFKSLCPGDPANVKDFTGIEKIAVKEIKRQQRDSPTNFKVHLTSYGYVDIGKSCGSAR